MNRPERSPRIVVTLIASILCALGPASARATVGWGGIIPASVSAPAVETTVFTIKGENFQSGSTVTVNGAPVQDLVFVDSSTLRVRLPGGIGPGQSPICVWQPRSLPAQGEESPTYPWMTIPLQVLPAGVEFVELRVGCDCSNGCVSCSGGSYPIGASVPVQAAPRVYYRMGGWAGDTEGCTDNGHELVVTMDRNRFVAPVFAPNLAPKGTPEIWLASHGLCHDTFATEELKDVDGDGMPAWAEYLAGTDPNDADSALRIGAVAAAGQDRVAVSFGAVAGRSYQLVTAPSLTQETWTPAEYSMLPDGAERTSASIPGMGGVVTVYVDANEDTPRYFRVKLSS